MMVLLVADLKYICPATHPTLPVGIPVMVIDSAEIDNTFLAEIAAATMAFSSISVLLNSLALKRLKFEKI